MADYSQEIAYLESVLNDAVSRVEVGETTTVLDLDAARKRLAELRGLDDDSAAAGRTRPRVFRTNPLFQNPCSQSPKRQDAGAIVNRTPEPTATEFNMMHRFAPSCSNYFKIRAAYRQKGKMPEQE
jgi:hypothetical protein